MKQQISLKLVVIIAFLSLAVVLVIGYSLLTNHFFHKGMRSGTSIHMDIAASSYVKTFSEEKRNHLNTFSGYQIARKWQQLPKEIRDVFDDIPPSSENEFMAKADRSSLFGPPDAMTFIFRYEDAEETLFVGRRTYRPPGPTLLGKNAAESRRMLFMISAAIAGILALTILLLLRHIAKPVAALEQWTRSLGPETLNQTPPDFYYPELNELANLVRTSLSSVQESLDREHSFLRYASHELRTPITIIRNNVELFSKISQLEEPQKSTQQDKVMNRIDRASLNMQHLTDTLLWLSRDNVEKLPEKDLDLDTMVKQLVEEMRYLIDRKDIQLHVETSPCTVLLPEIPAQIVLGNLVRNAFQHTWQGNITIHQQGDRVVISNTQTEEIKESQDLGFGLGLQLTAQLAEKLHWQYMNESEQCTHKVLIRFNRKPTTNTLIEEIV